MVTVYILNEQIPQILLHILTDSGHTCNIAAANLYCPVIMSCHYLAVIILQAPDPTAGLDLSEGVVAPPPVCLQGLGNEIETEINGIFNGLDNSQSKRMIPAAIVWGQYCPDLGTSWPRAQALVG